MNGKNIIAALAIALTVGIGATVYASDAPAPNVNTNTNNTETSAYCGGYGNGNGMGFRNVTGMRGFDVVTKVLKEKLNLTDADIENARTSGKTLSQLAQEKGMTLENFQSAMYDVKASSINEAVKANKISKEQGDELKATIKNNIDNCTGEGRGMMGGRGNRGGGRGMMRGGNFSN